MKFAERFSQLRIDNDVKQKELARMLNLSVASISHYETGVNFPDLKSLVEIANFFDVSLDYLVGRTDYKHEIDYDATLKLTKGNITYRALLNKIMLLNLESRDDLLKYLNLLLTAQEALSKSSIIKNGNSPT